ncbi:site-specific integrase [Chelativorans intermedius]|uniref:Site-specific integrase n=1 Tax=Chelativorans intermedius TaxID=515947 RepID=A0ABV6D7M1_9HYPH|nr:site-specific integrase [Chelativorans intermedius]MCT8999212.1 site-specific integrase [Chelativorans intermedius]
MKGHIRERSPGRWAIVLDIYDETGKRRRKWHSFAGTKRQAQEECARLIAEMRGGTYVEPSKVTIAKHLETWLDHMKSQVTPRTHERYSEIARKNIVPLIGSVPLTKLRPVQISDAYAKALASGRRDGKGGLAPSTIIYMHRIIKQALAQAVKWGMLVRNPADAVKPPKAERAGLKTLDMPQTAALIEGLRGSRMLIPAMLAVLCGLRRGEIVALRWRHVDLEAGVLSIVESAEQTREGVRYKAPKSGKGRTVALSATVREELRQHRLRQAEELLSFGIRQDEATFVYAQEDGSPLQPRTLTHAWAKAIAKTDLPRIRFHDLRHAHATHLLQSGVHPKVASERLGHSRVGVTLDIYSHVLPGMQEDAASRVDEALQLALRKRPAEGIR